MRRRGVSNTAQWGPFLSDHSKNTSLGVVLDRYPFLHILFKIISGHAHVIAGEITGHSGVPALTDRFLATAIFISTNCPAGDSNPLLLIKVGRRVN